MKRRTEKLQARLRRRLVRSQCEPKDIRAALKALDDDYERRFLECCEHGKYFFAEMFRHRRNMVRDLEWIIPRKCSSVGKTMFIIPTPLLFEVYGELANEPSESLVYVTGVRIGGSIVLTSAFRPEMSISGDCYAESCPRDTHRIMKFLTLTGHALHGQIHMHPGAGPAAVRPSPLDMRTHRGLISAYNLIDLIMTRDGFFFVYREKDDYTIEFYGKGVRKIDRQTWRLEIDSIPC